MSFIKFFQYDLKHGILRKYWLYFIYIFFVFIAVIQFQAITRSFEIFDYSVGDCILYIYGGKKEYIPRIGESFEPPYLWLTNHILLLYFGLNYMPKDLQGFGQQIIYRSGGRLTWWLSKCFWNVSFIFLFYFFGYLTIIILSLINGAEFSLDLSGPITTIIDFGSERIQFETNDLSFEIVLLPLLFSVSINMFQMMLSLLFKPIFSFVITVGICVASSYKLSLFLFGNYSMALRCNKAVANGFNSTSAIACLISILTISIFIGEYKITRCDILNRE